jgi:hypothetical protein
MSDSSDSKYPLVADGFAMISASRCLYSDVPTDPGGVWKGLQAIVVHVDDSASIDQLTSLEDQGGYGGTDLFDTTGKVFGWMKPVVSGSGNRVVNPD